MRLALKAIIASAVLAAPVLAQQPPAPNPLSDAIRTEALRTLEAVLNNRPDMITEAFIRDRQNIQRDRAALTIQALRVAQLVAELPDNPAGYGPTTGKMILVLEPVECTPCMSLHPALATHAAAGMRVVHIMLPAPRDGGDTATRAMHAAGRQGKWTTMHRELSALRTPVDMNQVKIIGQRIGADVARLEADMTSPEAELTAMRDIQMLTLLGPRRGTTVVVDSRAMVEAATPETLQQAIATATSQAQQGQNVSPASPSPSPQR